MSLAVIFSLLVNSSAVILTDHLKDDTVKLAESVASNYFDGKCLVLVADEGFLASFTANSTVLRISPRENAWADLLRVSFDQNCRSFIVQIAQAGRFFEAWTNALYEGIMGRNPRVLFLPTLKREMFDEIFSDRRTRISPNIVSVEANSGNCYYVSFNFNAEDATWPFKIVTNDFHLSVGTNPSTKLHLDDWNSSLGFKRHVHLFPNKILNLNQKSLRVMGLSYPPYSLVEPHLDGTEGRIIKLFCEIRNCQVTAFDDGCQWGEIDRKNQSGNGLIGSVYFDRADMGIGAFYLFEDFLKDLEYSNAYLRGCLTVLVPKEQPVSNWKTPFLPFEPSTWIGYFTCLVLSSLALYFVTRVSRFYFYPRLGRSQPFQTLGDSVIRSVAMSVLQQPTRILNGSSIRPLFTFFEFIYFILTALYAAELASHLTAPQYTPPIDDIWQLAKSGITWFVPQEVFNYGIKSSDDPLIQKALRQVEEANAFKIKGLDLSSGKYGVVIERTPGGHFVDWPGVRLEELNLNDVHVMKRNYYCSPLTTVLRKASPYAKEYNKIISKVLSAGLFYHWEGDVVRRHQNFRAQETLKHATRVHSEAKLEKLSVGHLVGAFIVYAFGVVIAASVFIGEKIVTLRK